MILKNIFSSRIKGALFVVFITILLGLIGYFIILFGGKLVVDEEALILDATTIIETTEGVKIGELSEEKRTIVTLNQVPQHVQDAFIAIEDVRFYQHAGVDFKSVIRAVYRDIIALSKVEGASTITQQLAKNLFLSQDKSWMRKTKEVMAAIYLEQQFSKDDILELYVNKIYFGHGVYGIETASQRFFSKPAEELSIAEGALLAGLAKAPNGYSPIEHPEKSLTRRNLVLQSMEKVGMISSEQSHREQEKTLGLQIEEREINPWIDSYIDLVMKEATDQHDLTIQNLKGGGYRIVVNVDQEIQQIAYNEFKKEHYFPGNTAGVEGAFVMMDHASGKIIAAIGGRDFQVGDLNRITVKRQPGSTIKPLAVYGPAMMKDDYQAYSLIRDEEIDHDGYTASNYDSTYGGAITIYEALTKSKNAPAVWLLDQIGIDYAKNYLKKMGLNVTDKGLAIALGGLSEGLTPLDMMTGYRTFAHNGEVIQSYTIERIYNQANEVIAEAEPVSNKVFSPQVAWNLTEILLNTVEQGTAQAGEYSKALAGKTGSTEHPFAKDNYKDTWFVGYTPEYVSALWMGYDRSDQDHYLTGGSEFPTTLTKAILSEMDKKAPLTAEFRKPANVDAVPKPIELPEIANVQAKYEFGGLTVVRGKIMWSSSLTDERIVYRIYQVREGIDKRIGEVSAETEFFINGAALLQSSSYYIVPYNPLTKMEGEHSEIVELSL